jgi:hypothetical protein
MLSFPCLQDLEILRDGHIEWDAVALQGDLLIVRLLDRILHGGLGEQDRGFETLPVRLLEALLLIGRSSLWYLWECFYSRCPEAFTSRISTACMPKKRRKKRLYK